MRHHQQPEPEILAEGIEIILEDLGMTIDELDARQGHFRTENERRAWFVIDAARPRRAGQPLIRTGRGGDRLSRVPATTSSASSACLSMLVCAGRRVQQRAVRVDDEGLPFGRQRAHPLDAIGLGDRLVGIAQQPEAELVLLVEFLEPTHRVGAHSHNLCAEPRRTRTAGHGSASTRAFNPGSWP